MKFHRTARAAKNATITGEVTLDEGVNVWYGAVLRGDCGAIHLGVHSVVEDNVVIHGNTVVGKRVIIGHGAILHGCTIEDECLIGMAAVVMDGVRIGKGSLIAAGSVVTKGTEIPAGSQVMGIPAQVVQPVSQEQQDNILHGSAEYAALAEQQLPLCTSLKPQTE